jgi:putative ABC transport system substrate-binding protein
MDRRALLGSLALATLVLPRAAPAQPARKVARIGILRLEKTADMAGPQARGPQVNMFLRGLRELGYVYGEHFVTEPRGADGKPERVPGLAAELVRLQVDVIVAAGPALPALKQATSTIPIVMGGASDPVADGLVRSLGQPGGNFTGLSLQSVEMIGKRLELLKELIPGGAPVAVLWIRPRIADWQAAETAAQARRWRLLSLEVRDVGEIEGAVRSATGAGAGALLVLGAGVFLPHARRIAELAAGGRLPAMYVLRPYVEAGGLVSYGADLNDVWRRAASFVDKILKGTKPGNLPVEQPTKFELVINLKAAKSLGLTIPPSVLLRADEVIQ